VETKFIKIDEKPLLFQDYLYSFPKLKRYFSWNPYQDWGNCIKKRLKYYKQREAIYNIIKSQNKAWKASENTFSNIELLKEDKTLAVVTGQQVGIFGGPLYTIYKIIHTIKLSHSLKSDYPEYNFVPIFWMEIGDNDFNEINQLHFLTLQNKIDNIKLSETTNDIRSIYKRIIPSEINDLIYKAYELASPSEFRDVIFNFLRSAYAPEKSYANAFARWINHLFSEYGLILFDPTDIKLKEYYLPLFLRTIESREEIINQLQKVEKSLITEKYNSQVKINPEQTLLFMEMDDESRIRLDKHGSGYILKKGDNQKNYTNNELITQIQNYPERITPNVLLRPILQDKVLPTVTYIAGPSEINYLAQLKPIYEIYDVEQPMYSPRCRITIIEKKIKKIIEKYDISMADIFLSRENLIKDYIKRISESSVQAIFQNTKEQIIQAFENLRTTLITIDPTLDGSIKRTFLNVDNSIQKLRFKVDVAFEKEMDLSTQQLNKIIIHLFPLNIFQERILNITHFMIKYGPNFIDNLYGICDISNNQHQLIFL
jgi:bacillithiol biosynthesis cysteine-adding enzyme BshC